MEETIAAIATPLGRGGVGIIRVSGPASKAVGRSLFFSGRAGFSGFKPYLMHHGHVRDGQGRTLDEVLAVFMPGPHSYTGEDVLEFHCHGGPAVLASVLEAVLALDVRPALPGEFTKRAFMNGRLDLTQAEAVAELIDTPAATGARLAQARLMGGLGQKVRALRQDLEGLKAQLCLAVDFPDEDVECLAPDELAQRAGQTADHIRGLLDAFERARCWRDGALVVLAGRVNAGKSSLLNALTGLNRAIVTDVPGTTRDYLEEHLNLGGLAVRLVDTAGLRDTGDIVELVEQRGQEMSLDLAARADLVLLTTDGSAEFRSDASPEQELMARLDSAKVLGVVNKLDLLASNADQSPSAVMFERAGVEWLAVSASQRQGLEELARRIRERVTGGRAEPDQGELAPNLRQSLALGKALEALQELKNDALNPPGPEPAYDLLGVHLDAACATLSEVTGEILPQDVLDAIFDDFCIGK